MKKLHLLLTGLLVTAMCVGCGTTASNNETQTENTQTELSSVSTEIQNSENTEDVQFEAVELEHNADLNHDGQVDVAKVSVNMGEEDSLVIKLAVNNGDAAIFEEEMYLHENLGAAYYLVSKDGADYLMHYYTSVNHDEALASYEVFSFNKEGEKTVLDSDEIQISLSDVATLDKASWTAFAEKENQYFSNAYLLISTRDAVLDYSDVDNKKTYTEQFHWLLSSGDTEYEVVDDVLDAFISEMQESYE